MAEDHIIEFIKKKEEFIREDYKLLFWFEFMFFDAQKQTYDERVQSFDRKLAIGLDPIKMKKFLNTNPFKNADRKGLKLYHLANLNGFVVSDELQITSEEATASVTDKHDNFLNAFKKIVQNRELVPSKTVILLDQSKHHTICPKRKSLAPITPNSKKLKRSAEACRKITEFYNKIKTPTMPENVVKKKTKEDTNMKYRFEELINEHRNDDDIQILLIPQNHTELDAAFITSIHFCSEVTRLIRDNESMSSQTAISEMLQIFPSHVWTTIRKQVEEYENFYKDRNSVDSKKYIKDRIECEENDEEFDDEN